MLKTLAIVIVNWNAREQLRACLQSILTADKTGFSLDKIVVVDNASTDHSLELIADIDLPIVIIKNKLNLGFGKACNQGAALCNTDYLLFLNPDTRLFSTSLTHPFSFMEQTEHMLVGILGIQLLDEQRKISRSCARFPTLTHFLYQIVGLNQLFPKAFPSHVMTEWSHAQNQKVDHVIGAFFWLRQRVFKELAGFDERFFVYLEDIDFSLRAQQRGWSSFYLADAQAFHKGGGTSDQIKARRLFYSLQSRLLYSYKHFGWFSGTILLLGTLIIEPITRVIFALIKGSKTRVVETLQGYKMLWQALPSIFRAIK